MAINVNNSNILILMSSGGGGHKSVARVRESAERDADHNVNIVTKDVMMDDLGSIVGGVVQRLWDGAQERGDIAAQKRLISKQHYSDWIFYLPIFVQTLRQLLSMDPPPRKVIITQVLGLSAIMKALEIYNFIMSFRHSTREQNPLGGWEDIEAELWMTDFVSTEAVHFLNPLAALSADQKEKLHIYAPNDRQMDQDLFFKWTNYPKGKVTFLTDQELPAPDCFREGNLRNITPHHDAVLEFKMTDEQMHLVKDLPNFRSHKKANAKDKYEYRVDKEDIFYSLSLGSQPTIKTTKAFIKIVAEMSRKAHFPLNHYHFFVFCGKDEDKVVNGKKVLSLFKQVVEELKNETYGKIPPHLTIVPLPFQSQDDIAKVKARSDKKFGRAGGGASMEEKVLQHTLQRDSGQVLIVSEDDSVTDEQLEQARREGKENEFLSTTIPVWEGANALNMVQTVGAKVVHLKTLERTLASDFDVREPVVHRDVSMEVDTSGNGLYNRDVLMAWDTKGDYQRLYEAEDPMDVENSELKSLGEEYPEAKDLLTPIQRQLQNRTVTGLWASTS